MSQQTQQEGVIKFDLQFTPAAPVSPDSLQELNTWRSIFWRHRLIGQDPARYQGYGFGNVSQRIAPFDEKCGKRPFVISGTQTGALEELDSMLDGNRFFKINRKYIVSIEACAQIIAWSNNRLKIDIEGMDDDKIVVARERVREFKTWLDS